MLIDGARSALLIVDVQERMLPAVAEPERVVEACAVLMQAARRLEVPTVLSEQYPKGLGPTVERLKELAPPGATSHKLHFSCAADPGLRSRLEGLKRGQIVVAGIETHVCVLQTALGLADAGLEPFVVEDACSSRRPGDHASAVARLRANRVETVTCEMVLFEWLGRAGTDEFKEVSRLVR